MKYLPTIGLETHVQLKTLSKMFCGCSTEYGRQPNSQVCPVCLGYPGAMPVMNRAAIHLTVRTGLMIGARINTWSKFDRKSYFYPDMPKNYQISQYDAPLCEGGSVTAVTKTGTRDISVTRIHLEEDVAKSTHFGNSSGIDFNRAGVPLMEIVTEPDIHSAEEAMAYLAGLKQILQYGAVSDCNLEEGNIRCDVNISVAAEGRPLGTKAELKNLNTFKGVFHAIEYEIRRQVEVLESGGRIIQETRRWDPDSGATFSMRTKEDAHDYRYFPEPDLMPVALTQETIEALRAALPELPAARRQRFCEELGLPEYDAGVLAADRELADFFEAVTQAGAPSKTASNWIMTDVLRVLGESDCAISRLKLTPDALAKLIAMVEQKLINMPSAREVFAIMLETGAAPEKIVEEKGLTQVSDSSEIGAWVEQAMQESPKSVEDFRNGKTAAAKYLVGQVMRMSRGKANPQLVTKELEARLNN